MQLYIQIDILTTNLTTECSQGFTFNKGDVQWSDVIGGKGGVMTNVLATGACGQKCNINSQCKAYNYSPSQEKCMLLVKQNPSLTSPYKDFNFCSKNYQPASPASDNAAAGNSADSTASSGCKGVKGNDCIFPFKYRGATFNNCKTFLSWEPGKPGKYGWCATEVKEGKMEKKENCVKECNKLMRK